MNNYNIYILKRRIYNFNINIIILSKFMLYKKLSKNIISIQNDDVIEEEDRNGGYNLGDLLNMPYYNGLWG